MPPFTPFTRCFRTANCEPCLSASYVFSFQFTLQCVLKGNKPDFHHAMGGVDSEPFYEEMLKDLAKNYDQEKIKGSYETTNSTTNSPTNPYYGQRHGLLNSLNLGQLNRISRTAYRCDFTDIPTILGSRREMLSMCLSSYTVTS